MATATPRQQAEFVADVERALAAQNQGWTHLLSLEPAAGTRASLEGT